MRWGFRGFWFGATTEATYVVPGKRTVEQCRTAEAQDKRWRGQIEPAYDVDKPQWGERVWEGAYQGDVVEQMNQDLGAVPIGDYEFLE